ncbi:MAG TPA: hypothetical protein VFW33_00580, partial [Gemmataceae bacterium]|nr:hypothetical protein [Gemmataceae bacterium]
MADYFWGRVINAGGNAVYVYGNKKIRACDLKTGKVFIDLDLPDNIGTVRLSPDEKYLLVDEWKGRDVISTATGKLLDKADAEDVFHKLESLAKDGKGGSVRINVERLPGADRDNIAAGIKVLNEGLPLKHRLSGINEPLEANVERLDENRLLVILMLQHSSFGIYDLKKHEFSLLV